MKRRKRAEMARPIAVLIVEDHLVLSEALIARIDQESDLRVVGAAWSRTQVTFMVGARRPDVVVLDLGLGDYDGIELIQPMRARSTGPRVVVLTGHDDTATALTALRHGASAFVSKAAPIGDLLQAIRTVAGGEPWISPAMVSRLLPELLAGAGEYLAEEQFPLLSHREREVLALMVDGLSNAAIAARLHISVHTARTHVHNLQKKLNVHSQLAAVALARQTGN
jgi:DNA-binding NarL/FixJ family response regulator